MCKSWEGIQVEEVGRIRVREMVLIIKEDNENAWSKCEGTMRWSKGWKMFGMKD